ncbi:dephospho-CoA kinase [Geosmithia morbida]|uniref:Dephospho-CoA kinase n=1 Tax=Geosmithia morbida TaxID=1094350 RepID=A0A9P4YY89_9HYPO|nr:dephospho-CoA kinase [Geosmithia morbida]KAF4123194.1 dephospho-CoA kinase [Geosmithia morbida]
MPTTGKSTVSSMLSSPPHSLPIIDADKLARDVVEPGTRGYAAILRHFHPTTPDLLVPASDTMPEDGPAGLGRPLNRPALGKRVFGDDEERRRDRAVLNAIVHPAVRRAMLWRVLGLYVRGHWAVVLDVPLLIESRLDRFCGVVAVVAVRDPAVQMDRLRKRDPHLSPRDAEARVSSQTDVRLKAARCQDRGAGKGIVLWNDTDTRSLQDQVDAAVSDLRARTPAWWSWALLACPPLAAAVAAWRFWDNAKLQRLWEEKERQTVKGD